MMSSEEDTECFGLYGDKLLKKNKRTRQRVDAGEPRNSYSSIPNFSSRPSFMSGGLYGALLSQSQQHFGLFGPNGFGSAKMLNELFGRQVKQAQDATGPDNMLSMESASSTDGMSAASSLGGGPPGGPGGGVSDVSGGGGGRSDRGTPSAGSNGGGNSNKLGFESTSSTNSSPIIRRTSSSGVDTDCGGTSPPHQTHHHQQQQQNQNDLAHHMLRNILQGKKELMALDHELRSSNNHHNGSAICERGSPDNNNSISKNNNNNNSSNNNNNNNNSNSNNNNNNTNSNNNNNNNNINGSVNTQEHNNMIKTELVSPKTGTTTTTTGSNCSDMNNLGGVGVGGVCVGVNSVSKNLITKSEDISRNLDDNVDDNSDNETDLHDHLQDSISVTKKECNSDDLLDDDMIGINSRSDLESLGSPSSVDNDVVNTKDELESELNLDKELITSPIGQSGVSGGKHQEPVALDMKRARVENIVSTMRSSPSLTSSQPQVNGCKKRKLYHPQQHDNSAVERYATIAANLNLGLNIQNLMLDEDEDEEMESPQIQQKRVEKNALKSQLRSMQEQLAEMQQKYVQLCSRMEQESECQEIDDTGSDSLDADDNTDLPQEKPTHRSTPVTSPLKELAPKTPTSTPHMLSQMMSKMMSSKMHNPLASHAHMQQTFNGTHPLLQHMQHGPGSNEHSVQNPHMQHHAISNAAAMYLGQKFFLEQEARMAKEAAEHHERQQQQERQHHHHHHQQQQQQERQHHHQQQVQQQHQQQQQHQAQHQSHQSQQQQQQQQQHQSQQQQHSQHIQHSLQQPQSQAASSAAQQVHHHTSQQQQHHQQQQQQPAHSSQMPKSSSSSASTVQSELSEKFNIIRSSTNSVGPMSGSDLEGLADILKSEITASLSTLVDSIVTRFVHQRRFLGKHTEAAAAAAEQLNKDLLMASQLLDRKSPRTKVADRSGNSGSDRSGAGMSGSQSVGGGAGSGNSTGGSSSNNQSGNGPNNSNSQANNSSISHTQNSHISNQSSGPRLNGTAFPPMGLPMHVNGPLPDSSNSNLSSLNIPPPHVRPSPSAAMFQAPKPPHQGMNPVAAAALYNSMNALGGHASQVNPFCMPEPRDQNQEQNEALSLVVTPKKKRHKVTDTRITPRTVSRILAQDGIGPPPPSQMDQPSANSNHSKFNNPPPGSGAPTSTPSESPSPRSAYHPPPSAMLPVSLPTSVAIPNPSLHESQVFSPYSPFFNPHGPHGHVPHAPQPTQLHHMHQMSSSPPGLGGMMDPRDSPPLSHPPTMLHPALLAAAHHGSSPDYGHLRAAMDANDRSSDCNSGDISFDGIQPTSSTLTPMHLRKAKLMFFWVRYPSSAVLKMYFPDIKFNKNNTAQLVKWFSNFREFYYIQMEKYARQAVSEGVKSADDLHVSGDSELYRVLNLHYNRNNHIEVCRNQVPPNFRYVVEQTLREFFRAIQTGKDTEQSWKKSIYKIISRLDDPVPEYFKSPNFLEQLE